MIEIALDPFQYDGPVWNSLAVGDGIVWNESGALYIVKERAIDDGKSVTFILQCVTPGPVSDHGYGSLCQWNVSKFEPIPHHITLVKPSHE